VFAYAYMLPENETAGVLPIDPRARLAVDFYNQALAEALGAVDGNEVILKSGDYRLPFGNMRVTIDPRQFIWAGYRFTRFVPVSHFAVRGLRNRYRQSGVGAPLAADIEPAGSGPDAEAARKRIPPRTKVPVTAFLRINQPLRGVLQGNLEGHLEIYTTDHTRTLRVGQRDVPLEFESTAAIAYQLEGAPVWDMEIAGFRFAETPVLGDGLIMLQPYRPGRIPVVVVHGTASSPARWAEMYNEISNDILLRDRYQFWLFQYNTGQPVLYSAMLLRRALRSAINEVDPDGMDAPLRRMVIIGHSQGGLLTKLMAVKSGTRFWENVTKEPFDKFEQPPETRTLLKEGMFFEPVAELERVVFIATPHRGSFRAVSWVQALVRKLISMPGRLTTDTQSLFTSPALRDSGLNQLPTSIDNIRAMSDVPIDPRIKAHSIIPVIGAGAPDNLNDGVVTYRSAHIEGVESELVVRSSHSTQAVPETIEEVRRILREHLGVKTDAKYE